MMSSCLGLLKSACGSAGSGRFSSSREYRVFVMCNCVLLFFFSLFIYIRSCSASGESWAERTLVFHGSKGADVRCVVVCTVGRLRGALQIYSL